MHTEYKHIVRGSPVAVLFIHGITGTPDHFREWIKVLPKDFSVHNLLLAGHGKGVRDFSKASMKKWRSQVSQAVEELAQSHEQIYVVAHSMGTLLSIEESLIANRISKLYLLAVPLKIWPNSRMFLTPIKIFFDRIDPNDPIEVAAKRCYGIAPDKNLFHYLGWIPRYLELFSLIRKTRKVIRSLSVPTFAFQSKKDEIVSLRSNKFLEENPNISLTILQNSVHYYYAKEDLDLLLKAFTQFIA